MMRKTQLEMDLENKLRHDLVRALAHYCDLSNTMDISGPNMLASTAFTLASLLIVTAKTGDLSKEQLLQLVSKQWDRTELPPVTQSTRE